MGENDLTILVVDDERRLADLFATWLGMEYDVRTAYDGEEALEAFDADVDIALLDRRMPGLSGDEVLAEIRDRGADCRVVMVTAVDPDFDIIEMGFDDYLVKPVSKDDLFDIVERVSGRADYDANIQRYYALASKKGLLESEKPQAELDENEEYQELVAEFERVREDVDETVHGLEGHDEFARAFKDLGDGGEIDPEDLDAEDV